MEMNKIKIVNGEIVICDITDAIRVSLCEEINLLSVNNLTIDIVNDSDIEIFFEGTKETKFNIELNISKNINVNMFEIRTGEKTKIQYIYNIDENSTLNISKFYNMESIKEADIIELNGINSKINYNLKTISKDKEKYDIYVNHNCKNTESNISNNGVNILNGTLIFNVTSSVPNNITDCTVNQNNHIISLNENKCQINPNLLIGENDVTANHSALIGKFSDEELFYLMSRGISEKEAYNLLIKGLLLNGLNTSEENIKLINNIIDKYWR